MVRRPVSGPRRASLKSAPGTFAEPKSSARQRISCTRVSGMKCRKAFFGRWREGVPSSLSGKGLRLLNGPPAKTSGTRWSKAVSMRSEEHTSELQSHSDVVCRLLLEKKKHISDITG